MTKLNIITMHLVHKLPIQMAILPNPHSRPVARLIERGVHIRGVGRIFMEGFLKRRAQKNSKPRPFGPYLPDIAHYSDDLLAGLQRK